MRRPGSAALSTTSSGRSPDQTGGQQIHQRKYRHGIHEQSRARPGQIRITHSLRHDPLAVGGRELGRGLGDAASGVPATAQCR